MNKVKVFTFLMSDFSTGKELATSEEEIEKTINNYISSNSISVIDIKTNTLVTYRHNNGRSDMTYLIYTIHHK